MGVINLIIIIKKHIFWLGTSDIGYRESTGPLPTCTALPYTAVHIELYPIVHAELYPILYFILSFTLYVVHAELYPIL